MVGSGDQMGQVRIRADRRLPQRRTSASRTVALGLAAFAFSAAVAAWAVDPGDAALVSANAAPSRASAGSSFDERFLPAPAPQSLARNFSSQSLDRAATAAVDIRALQAREQLARQMQSQDWRTAADEPAPPPATTLVPLPRARPSEARLEVANRAAASADSAAPSDQRTLLQKL